MEEPSTSASAERELRELRERAYGPHPDIEDDPVAIARLVELEAARVHVDTSSQEAVRGTSSADPIPVAMTTPAPAAAAAPTMTSSTGTAGPSLRQTAGATRVGRAWLIVGGSVAVLALVWVVGWAVGPHPQATLQETFVQPGARVNGQLEWTRDLQVDTTTLRGFEGYRGLEVWAAEDAYGSPCLIVIDPSIDRPLGDECTPEGADLLTDATVSRAREGQYGEDLPAGSVIRFHHRGDTVDVYLFPTTAATG